MYSTPNFDSARWMGADLSFDVTTDGGLVQYVVRASRLQDVAQRTGVEALQSNWPRLKRELRHPALGPSGVVTVD